LDALRVLIELGEVDFGYFEGGEDVLDEGDVEGDGCVGDDDALADEVKEFVDGEAFDEVHG